MHPHSPTNETVANVAVFGTSGAGKTTLIDAMHSETFRCIEYPGIAPGIPAATDIVNDVCQRNGVEQDAVSEPVLEFPDDGRISPDVQRVIENRIHAAWICYNASFPRHFLHEHAGDGRGVFSAIKNMLEENGIPYLVLCLQWSESETNVEFLKTLQQEYGEERVFRALAKELVYRSGKVICGSFGVDQIQRDTEQLLLSRNVDSEYQSAVTLVARRNQKHASVCRYLVEQCKREGHDAYFLDPSLGPIIADRDDMERLFADIFSNFANGKPPLSHADFFDQIQDELTAISKSLESRWSDTLLSCTVEMVPLVGSYVRGMRRKPKLPDFFFIVGNALVTGLASLGARGTLSEAAIPDVVQEFQLALQNTE